MYTIHATNLAISQNIHKLGYIRNLALNLNYCD